MIPRIHAVVLSLSVLSSAAYCEVFISEFMAANRDTAVPGAVAGQFDDWLEIHNSGEESVNLENWSLTDDPEETGKWRFPAVSIQPGEYLVILASGESQIDPSKTLGANFALSSSGEYLGLYDADGMEIHAYGDPEAQIEADREYPEQRSGYSYGLKTADGEEEYYASPTPGATNGSGILGFVDGVDFSRSRGFVDASFDLTLTSETPDVKILYTTDGREPSEGNVFTGPIGEEYSGPITIDTTTVVRTRAYKNGWEDSKIKASTYLFLDDVIRQPDEPEGYNNRWGGQSADYGMDPDIVDHPDYKDEIIDALKALPTVAVSLAPDDLFSSSDGIYYNATQGGFDWERACSAEWIEPDGTTGFEVGCGIRVQGGASRNQDRSPKHSFSLRFRDVYGPGNLDFDMFPGSPVRSFDSIQLRAMYNNSWIHSNGGQRQRATMIRDQWMRDSMLEMGNITSGRGRYVHLYLNGLYWGVHNLHERQDADHYARYYDLGDDTPVDALNGGTVSDGSLSAYNAMKAVARDKNWDDIQGVLNVDNYIDWTIMHRFAGSQDLKNNGNWRAAGGGPSGLPYEYYLWDVERVLEDPGNNGVPIPSADPTGILNTLEDVPEFVVRFGDRVQKHLFGDGALTAEANMARLRKRMEELDTAIIAESARWGDYRAANSPYTRDSHWQTELDRLLENYFPVRNEKALDNFRDMGLYPDTDPVEYSRQGGDVDKGFELTLTSNSVSIFSQGIIYYTTDGSDPRMPGGAVSDQAVEYEKGSTIDLDESVRITGRVRTLFGSWSALATAYFRVGVVPASPENVVISELHYHPTDPNAAEIAAGFDRETDFEFIELLNTSDATVYLDGSAFTDGIEFVFPDGSEIAPGQRLVLASDSGGFAMRYGSVTAAGEYEGALSNGGETVELTDRAGEIIASFRFVDDPPWPASADGDGPSLVLNDAANHPDPDVAGNWVAGRPGGTPGRGEEGGVVEIDPPVLSVSLTDQVTLEFDSVTGTTYQLEMSADLTPGSWNAVGDATAGTGARISVSTMREAVESFYRVRLFTQ